MLNTSEYCSPVVWASCTARGRPLRPGGLFFLGFFLCDFFWQQEWLRFWCFCFEGRATHAVASGSHILVSSLPSAISSCSEVRWWPLADPYHYGKPKPSLLAYTALTSSRASTTTTKKSFCSGWGLLLSCIWPNLPPPPPSPSMAFLLPWQCTHLQRHGGGRVPGTSSCCCPGLGPSE